MRFTQVGLQIIQFQKSADLVLLARVCKSGKVGSSQFVRKPSEKHDPCAGLNLIFWVIDVIACLDS